MKKLNRILITGANGFIGYHLTRRLVKEGFEVTALVRSHKRIEELNKLGVNIVFGDITKKETYIHLLKSHDIVVHLAATKSNWIDSDQIMKVNSLSIGNFFSRNTSLNHIILTSSVYALGRISNSVADERSPLRAYESYGKSKILAEEVTRKLSRKYSIPFTIIRPAIVYGPGDSDLGLVIKMIKLVKRKKMYIIGTGKNLLHLVYIDDLIEGYLKVIKKGGYNQTYILAGEKTVSQERLINLIKKELGMSYLNLHVPKNFLLVVSFIVEKAYYLGKILNIKCFFNEPFLTSWKVVTLTDNWRYNISKAQEDLDFKPKISYEKGIKRTVAWYLKNKFK